MLSYLNIKNYALIEDIEIDLGKGLTTITGETGAGKSIILGAISLLAGNRADRSMLKKQDNKCIIEASFSIGHLGLKEMFEEFNLDFNEDTLIRREFSPDGKSRVFVNDSPAALLHLKEIMNRMLDVHSQHENLDLNNRKFQLKAIDLMAGNHRQLEDFQITYKAFLDADLKLKALAEKSHKLRENTDLFAHQLNELSEASLEVGEQEKLEEELDQLNNSEEIKLNLQHLESILNEGESNPIVALNQLNALVRRTRDHFKDLVEVGDRLENLVVELEDIRGEIERLAERFSYDPERLQIAQDRISQLYQLQQKYRVNSVAGLIEKREVLREEMADIENLDEELGQAQNEFAALTSTLTSQAEQLSASRYSVLTEMEEKVTVYLRALGMVNSQFKIELQAKGGIGPDGSDQAEFLFSANKGLDPRPIIKVASGGELSRLMLSIKALLTSKSELPTIIFDEIDTGISGVIAEKMGKIILDMCHSTQVLAITHLPQIAAMGHRHLMVYKDEEGSISKTNIKEITGQERVEEIARLLSGEVISKEALDNAKVLLSTSA
jgi:DNA repair protein RecN (Recombination protein N)